MTKINYALIYLAKRTTRTATATESPIIPMKVATPFKRTYSRTNKIMPIHTIKKHV